MARIHQPGVQPEQPRNRPAPQKRYRKTFKWHPGFVSIEHGNIDRDLSSAFAWPGFYERRYSGYHMRYLYRSRKMSTMAKAGHLLVGSVLGAFWIAFWLAMALLALKALVVIAESR